MEYKHAIPDLTWSNIRILLRSNGKSMIVLSSKECQGGVSPKSSLYLSILVSLGSVMGFFAFLVLRRKVDSFVNGTVPENWGRTIKELIIIFIEIICWATSGLISFLFSVIVSFRIENLWIPTTADNGAQKTACN